MLQGPNSPLRQILVPNPGDRWEEQKRNVRVTPGTSLGRETPGLTVVTRMPRGTRRDEAVLLTERIREAATQALHEATGNWRNGPETQG